VFSPFNLEDIQIRYRDKGYGKAVPHRITRHTHPKARPETSATTTPPPTGIDYLAMVADTHHRQIADDERIGFHALYSDKPALPAQLPGQLSIDDLDVDTTTCSGDSDAGETAVPA